MMMMMFVADRLAEYARPHAVTGARKVNDILPALGSLICTLCRLVGILHTQCIDIRKVQEFDDTFDVKVKGRLHCMEAENF